MFYALSICMNAQQQTLVTKEALEMATQKILLIETPEAKSDNQLHSKLVSQNAELVDALESATDLVNKVESSKPDVLVLSVDFLDAVMLDQLIKVKETCPLAVTVFAKQHAPEVLKTVISAGVSSYVVDDVQPHRLPIIIDLAAERFSQMNNLSTELEQTKEKLNERKVIERAKGILMQQKHLTEDEAYVQMRKSAMNQGESMAELARRVISVFDILEES